MKIFGYGISIEGRGKLKMFRGHRVPFTIRIRYHYPSGSRIVFHMFSNTWEWARGL